MSLHLKLESFKQFNFDDEDDCKYNDQVVVKSKNIRFRQSIRNIVQKCVKRVQVKSLIEKQQTIIKKKIMINKSKKVVCYSENSIIHFDDHNIKFNCSSIKDLYFFIMLFYVYINLMIKVLMIQ
jgi:23S rRNA G2069 N7-methylase RlmK/C1962 C5-methylase RlmI